MRSACSDRYIPASAKICYEKFHRKMLLLCKVFLSVQNLYQFRREEEIYPTYRPFGITIWQKADISKYFKSAKTESFELFFFADC